MPRPDRFFVNKAYPSSQTVLKWLASISDKASGSRTVPSTSPTDRVGRKGSGATMVDIRARVQRTAASPGSTRLMPGWNPISRSEPCETKVNEREWRLKALLPCFRLSTYFGVYGFPLFRFLAV